MSGYLYFPDHLERHKTPHSIIQEAVKSIYNKK